MSGYRPVGLIAEERTPDGVSADAAERYQQYADEPAPLWPPGQWGGPRHGFGALRRCRPWETERLHGGRRDHEGLLLTRQHLGSGMCLPRQVTQTPTHSLAD